MATRKTQTTVFLESSVLIPLLESGNPVHSRVLSHLTSQNALVAIDTIVLSEYLAGLNDSIDKNEVVERFARQFRVHTFDASTAIVCAELFRILKSKGMIPKQKSDRQVTKADIMIMASAIVSGVDEFLFEDGHFSSYLRAFPSDICGHKIPSFIRAQDLPPEIVQEKLDL